MISLDAGIASEPTSEPTLFLCSEPGDLPPLTTVLLGPVPAVGAAVGCSILDPAPQSQGAWTLQIASARDIMAATTAV
jgi:hypothetical protein